MKLLTWNCAGAFRKKTGQLASFNPDLVVIQECERPEKLLFPHDFRPDSIAWSGDSGAAKGIGVFGFSGLRVEVAGDVYDPTIRYCVPLRVTGAWNFHLIAIWAMPHVNPREWSYVGQVCRALETYAAFIRAQDTLLVGDFNSNQIFDRRRRACNHSTVVEQLAQDGIVSLYHEYFHESHGQESRPTFYLTRMVARPFHLDYCFAPIHWSQRITRLVVGDFAEWRPWSDHCPLFVEFDL
jgi:exodeoxyribonuclease III